MRAHGGDVFLASDETAIPISEIIDFSASINPLGMPASVVAAVRESIPLLVHYPDPFAERLGARLANWLELDPRSVVCGNGSTELIYLLVRALTPRRVLLPQPTFSEYERACRMRQGTDFVRMPLSQDRGFAIDPEQFIAAMAGCDLAFLCNPNNPTGTVLKRNDVLAVARAAKQRDCWLVVDEAFIDFLPEHSVTRDTTGNDRLIVLRSLTKFYALSGLRAGYAVLPGAVAARLRERKEPWTVNTLAQQAAIAAIGDGEYQARTMQVIGEGKKQLADGFRALGIAHPDPAANFFLLKMEQAQEAVARLRGRGILVRDCSNFTGLDSSYIRIAVRSRRENERLLEELGAVCARSS